MTRVHTSSDFLANFPADDDALFGGISPVPDTTIQNMTITVTATTNYTTDTIANVPGITFQTTTASVATFLASQFAAGGIASNATITGDAYADTIAVNLGATTTFDGTHFVLDNWSASDKFSITGTAGNDRITGTGGNDLIVAGAGSDTIKGGAGNDTINMGANFDSTDFVDGNAGTDVLKLSGDYSTQLNITSAMLQGVEKISLAGGNSYNLVIYPDVVAAGQKMIVDASALGVNDSFTLDMSNDTAGKYEVFGGAGTDYFDLNDQVATVYGGTDQNFFYTYGTITNKDQIVGTVDSYLYLDGDFSTQFAFKAHTIADISTIYLAAGHDYNLKFNAANVPTGNSMGISGDELGVNDSMTINGSHVSGNLLMFAGAGLDTLTGGSGNNNIYFGAGAPLVAADRIDGGAGGYNFLNLTGDYSAGLKFASSTISNFQAITLANGYNYNLTMADGNVAAGQTLILNAANLDATHSVIFDGSRETNGNFVINGGAGNDTLTGGAGADTLDGGAGADTMNGGGGADTFLYTNVGDSTSTGYDTIVGFNTAADIIKTEIGNLVGAIDSAVTAGALSKATFDTNLAGAVGAGQLHVGDAVLFTPNSGDLAGHTFLIIDENGVAGYQAGADLVIDITGATNLGSLSTANFAA